MKGTSTTCGVEGERGGGAGPRPVCVHRCTLCACVCVCSLWSCAFLLDSLLNYATCAKVAPKSRLKIARIEPSGLENCLIGCNFEFKYFHKATQRETAKWQMDEPKNWQKIKQKEQQEEHLKMAKNCENMQNHSQPTDSIYG